MIKEAIGVLIAGKPLTMEESAQVMEEIMEGQATPAQLGAFLTALSIRGETPDVIAGLARVMREKAVQVKTDGPVLDIVGTGGDGLNTFNISTTAALIAAGAGVKVAKHGNRAATSQCGSADVLEKLGVKINLTAEEVRQCIREVGIGFMFAPIFHPAMRFAGGPRREIGIRTVFNILGPLTNPAHAEYQVLGVPGIELAEKIVPALMCLGIKHALVVHGLNGMDELSTTGESVYWEIKNGKLHKDNQRVVPEDFGLKSAPGNALRGGTPEENAQTAVKVLKGEAGPFRDVVILNAAAALLAGDKVGTLKQGVTLAAEILDSGRALEKLTQLVELTQSFKRN